VPAALTVALHTWAIASCGGTADRKGRNTSAYAERVVREVESRVVAGRASGIAQRVTRVRPCVISRDWSFTTALSDSQYRAWLKQQLSPDFKEVITTDGRLAFSRYDQADVHSLTVEIRPDRDSVRVLVTLCVFPD
jgi:hypothetical protein